MAGVIVSVAEAVKEDLRAAQEAGTFGALEWQPLRSYAEWDLELVDQVGVRVDVVAVGSSVTTDRESGTNSSLVYRIPIDIGVRKKLDPADEAANSSGDPRVFANDAIDLLIDLTETIAEFFAKPDFRPSYDEAVWQDTTIRAMAPRNHLREWRQFTGIVRVTFRVDRELS